MSARIVDLFAGAGGASTGATMAGAHVVAAANHWPFAVETHELNHPTTRHECQDIRQMDWCDLPPFDGLWGSPGCQVYSKANARKAGTRVNGDRPSAWAVLDCAEVCEPRFVIVENVVEFMTDWRLFPEWRECLVKLGYTVSVHVLRASHHGVPQRRDRGFVVATKSGGEPQFLQSMTEPAFGPCIEWDAGEWREVARAPDATRSRLEAALRNHGPRCLSQHTTGHRGIGLGEPIRTITTKDHWLAVDGDRYRSLTVREYLLAQSFPFDYRFPTGASKADMVKAIGNAVPPLLARDVIAATLEVA